MFKGTTKSGFQFEIQEEVFDDYELLETLVDADNGDNMAIFKAIDMILDGAQKNKLKEHVRNENGRVPASAMVQELIEIMEASNYGKNS